MSPALSFLTWAPFLLFGAVFAAALAYGLITAPYARKEALPPERRAEIAKLAAEARWSQPLQLIEDAETGDRFVLYTKADGMAFELRFEGEEPWATQKQMCDLFGIKQPTIAKHIRNIFDEQEVDEGGNIQKMNIAGSTKPVTIYSLDVVLAVGYRASRDPRQKPPYSSACLRPQSNA